MDFDVPMTGTQVKVLLVGLLVMGGFGIALFGGAIPGLKPNFATSNVVVYDGERFNYTLALLSQTNPISNTSLPQTYYFDNVTFVLWVTNWNSYWGGLVHGNGTERNGTVYSFVLGLSYNPPVNTTLFISPDREFGAHWPGGFLAGPWVELLVRS